MRWILIHFWKMECSPNKTLITTSLKTFKLGFEFSTGILSEKKNILKYQIPFFENPGFDIFFISLSYTLLVTLTMT